VAEFVKQVRLFAAKEKLSKQTQKEDKKPKNKNN